MIVDKIWAAISIRASRALGLVSRILATVSSLRFLDLPAKFDKIVGSRRMPDGSLIISKIKRGLWPSSPSIASARYYSIWFITWLELLIMWIFMFLIGEPANTWSTFCLNASTDQFSIGYYSLRIFLPFNLIIPINLLSSSCFVYRSWRAVSLDSGWSCESCKSVVVTFGSWLIKIPFSLTLSHLFSRFASIYSSQLAWPLSL